MNSPDTSTLSFEADQLVGPVVALVEQNAIELDLRNVCRRTGFKVTFRAVGWRARQRDCECRVGDLSFGKSCFDARSRGLYGSRGRAASREARGKVADHDVRSGASGACDERTPKSPNERSIEADSPTDLERPCARASRASRNRALERRSCIAHQRRETGSTHGRLAESVF